MTEYVDGLWWDAEAHTYRCKIVVRGRQRKASFVARDRSKAQVAAARALALEWLRQQERDRAGMPRGARAVTAEQARDAYTRHLRERGSPETTHRYYAAKWVALIGSLPESETLDRITPGDVSEYVAARRAAKVCNRTIRAELGLLARATRMAGWQPRWTLPRLRITEHPRAAPPPEDVARLWRATTGPAHVALALCLLTGMRASEAYRAEAEDVDRARAVLRLRGRKAGGEHLVPVVGTLAALLPTSGPLVAASENAVRLALRRASVRCRIVPRWTGPGLGRHCFATWAVEHGGYSTGQVADALGHSRGGAVTLRYIHAEAVARLIRPIAECVEQQLLVALGIGASQFPDPSGE